MPSMAGPRGALRLGPVRIEDAQHRFGPGAKARDVRGVDPEQGSDHGDGDRHGEVGEHVEALWVQPLELGGDDRFDGRS